MQKKILASLLVSPVALNALANIDMGTLPNTTGEDGAFNWAVAGSASADHQWITTGQDGKETVNAPMTTILSQTYTVKALGTYKFTINNPTNCKFTVNAGNKDYTAAEDGSVTVEGLSVDDAVTVTVAVANTNIGGFSFDGVSVEVVFDFDDVTIALAKDLIAIHPKFGNGEAYNANNVSAEKLAEFNKTREELTNGTDGYVDLRDNYVLKFGTDTQYGVIDFADSTLDPKGYDKYFTFALGTAESKLAGYTEWELYKYYNTDAENNAIHEDKISAKIAGLKTKVEAFHADVKAELDRFALDKKNKQAAAALGTASDLTAQLKTVKDQIDAKDDTGANTVSEAIRTALAADTAAIAADIAAYEKAVADALAATNNGESEFVAPTFAEGKDYEGISLAIEKLKAKFESLVANEAAWAEIGGLKNTLFGAYSNALNAISAFKGVTKEDVKDESGNVTEKGYDYTNNYSDKQDEWKLAVGAIYDQANNILADITADTAADNLAAAKAAVNGTTTTSTGEDDTETSTTVNGAVKDIQAAVAEYEATVTAQNGLMTTALATIAAQQQTLDDAKIADIETFATNGIVSTDDKAKYDEYVKNIQAAINSLKSDVEGKYAKCELAEGDPSTTDVDALYSDNTETSYVGFTSFLNDLNIDQKQLAYNDYKELVDALAQGTTDLNNTINLEDKFSVTLDILLNGVKNLSGTYENSDLANNISTTSTTAQQLVAALTGAYSGLQEFNTVFGYLKSTVDRTPAKTILEGDGAYNKSANYDEDVKAIQKTYDGLNSQYTAAIADENTIQQIIDQAAALSTAITDSNWAVAITKAFNDYENEATQANVAVAAAAVNAVQKGTPEIGDSFTAFGNITTRLETLETNTNSLSSTDVTSFEVVTTEATEEAEATTSVSEDVKAKIDSLAAYDEEAKAIVDALGIYVDAQKAYNDVDKALTTANLDSLISELTQTNEAYNKVDNTESAAYQFFNDSIAKLQTKATSIQTTLDADFSTAIEKTTTTGEGDDAVSTTVIEKFKIVDTADSLKTVISALQTEIGNLKAQIKTNDDYYKAELAASQNTRKAIADIYDTIKYETVTETGEDGTETTTQVERPADLVKEYLDALDELRNVRLLAADVAVAALYAHGDCSVTDGQAAILDTKYATNLVDEYKAITAAADSVKASFADADNGYQAKVIQANAETKAQKWTITAYSTDLQQAYLAAINAYAAYDRIANAGYKSYLKGEGPEGNATSKNLYTSHADVYDAQTAYNALVAEVDSTFSAADQACHVVTEAEMTALTDEAQELIKQLEDKLATMTSEFNEAGKAYYNIIEPAAQTAISTATSACTAQDLTEDEAAAVLKAPIEQLKKATDAYAVETATEGENAKNGAEIGLAMDGIATEIDKVEGQIDLQTGAVNYWNGKYEEFSDSVAILATQLEALKDSYATNYAEKKALYDAAVSAAATLNTAALDETELINTLKEKVDALAAYLTDASNAVKAIQEDNDNNQANAEAYEGYNGDNGLLPTLLGKIDELKAFVAALGGASASETVQGAVTAAETAYTNLAAYIETNKATLTGNVDDSTTPTQSKAEKIAADNTDAEAAVTAAYNAAYTAENTYLKDTLLDQAKVSHNNATAANVVAADDTDEAKAAKEANNARLVKLRELIDKAQAAIAALPTSTETSTTDSEGNITVTTNAPADYQKVAVEIESNLCSYISEMQAMYETTESELTVADAADAIDDAVANLETALSSAATTAGSFPEGYDEEQKDAEADDATYAAQVAALQEQFDALKAEIEAAKTDATILAKQSYYEQELDKIGSALSEVMNRCATALNTAAAHQASDDNYATIISTIYEPLQTKLEELKTQVDSYALTVDYSYTVDNTMYTGSYNDVIENAIEKKLLADAKESLESAKTAYTVQATSFDQAKNNINYAIEATRLSAMVDYAKAQQVAAAAALSEVSSVLNNPSLNILADVKKEASDAYASLTAEKNTLDNSISSFSLSDYLNNDGTNAKDDDGIELNGVVDLEGYITESQGIATSAAAILEKLTEATYTPGDITGDGFGISDIQTLIGWIGNGVTLDQITTEYGPTTATAADVNGDGAFTVGDITLMVDMLVNPSKYTVAALVRGLNSTDSSFDAVLVSEEGGIRTYALNLNNVEAFVAGQLDLTVAAGSEIVEVVAGERLAAHDMQVFDNPGATRLVISSLENAQIAGHDGATVYVRVKGHSTLGVTNAIFADDNSQQYAIGDKTPGTSGIDSIIDGARVVKEAIYDAAGRALSKMQRGINIIRHSDGTVTKELRK